MGKELRMDNGDVVDVDDIPDGLLTLVGGELTEEDKQAIKDVMQQIAESDL